MNRLTALLACLALGGLIAFWVFEDQVVEPEETATPSVEEPGSAALEAEQLAEDSPVAWEDQRSAQTVEGAPTEAAAPPREQPADLPADFTWTGRVLDASGAPLAGCEVGLTAQSTSIAFQSKRDFLALAKSGPRARTDSDGRFALSGRAEDFARGLWWALPQRELAMGLRTIREQPEPASSDLRSPEPGERDLGDLTLGPAGWLTGRVADEIGAPVEGAIVRLGREGSFYSEAQLGVLTAADGSFELGHLPPGKFMANASLEGRLPAVFGKFSVVAGEATDVGELVLAPAYPLYGRVIDREGQPVAGARVQAFTDDWDSSDQVQADEEGRFTAFVSEATDHRLEVSARGFQTFGASGSSDPYPVGGAEVVIVLAPELRVTFAVTDARTGEPVTRFGLVILEGQGSQNSRKSSQGYGSSTPSYRDRESGRVSRGAVPGIDSVIVRAPGFESFSGDVALDPGESARMTVALEPTTAGGWSLTGRLVASDGPVADARVTSYGLITPRESRQLSSEEVAVGLREAYGWIQDDYGMERDTTDPNGSFAYERPAPGQRLLLANLGERCAVAGPLTVRTGEDLDLGDVQVGPWARLAGRLRLPEGVEPSALTLRLDPQGATIKPNSDGSFEVQQLYPLNSHLSVAAVPGVLLPPLPLPVQLRPDETTELEWDLRGAAAVRVNLELRAFGEPAAWRFLRAMSDDGGPSVSLGSTDEEGRLTADIPAGGSLRWAVSTANRTWWEHPVQRIHPTAELQVLDIELPSVHLRLPADQDLDAEDTVQLELEPSDGEDSVFTFAKAEARGDGQLWVTVRDLSPGTYRLRAMLTKKPEAENSSWIRDPREDTATEFDFELQLGGQLELNWADGQGDD